MICENRFSDEISNGWSCKKRKKNIFTNFKNWKYLYTYIFHWNRLMCRMIRNDYYRASQKYQSRYNRIILEKFFFFRYDVATGDLHLEERTKGRKNLLLERWRGRKFRGGGQALLQELNLEGETNPVRSDDAS